MFIDAELCAGCRSCFDYCPIAAIKAVDGAVAIDTDECVECHVCIRSKCCPNDAITETKLEWPRIIRALFSDPITVHPGTGVAGRGTEELKTNELTNRFGWGEVGIGVEMGRPNTGTSFRELEKVTRMLAKLNVHFEPSNPVTLLLDTKTGTIQEDVLAEKVLTAIIEFKIPEQRTEEVLTALKDIAGKLDTVFSLDMINRYPEDGRIASVEIAKKLGFSVAPNGKVCIGIGRLGN